MDINIGIDSKPRVRRGRRRFADRLVTLAGDRSDDINDPDSNITLNVRVKERENSGTRKSPLGNIFKDTSTTAIKGLFCKESSYDLKDTIKRPLTGLFRRPTYRSNSKFGLKSENKAGTSIFASEASNCRNENVISQSLETPCFEGVLHDVANAPVINISQVSAVYQFDFMNAKNASLAKLDDIDLSLLSRFLCLEEEVNDEKVSWTWDYLFGSVSTEMRDEWTQDEERDDGDYEDGNLTK
uniref:Condensin complex subunit 2 n=1 Tax=Wuchereria bancrofti TaxID=6293 RepID=A0AAF5PX53_WUCBA